MTVYVLGKPSTHSDVPSSWLLGSGREEFSWTFLCVSEVGRVSGTAR